jgi:hypothetical protein
VAAHSGERRIAFHGGELTGQARWEHPVVGIHARDEASSTPLQPVEQGGDETAVGPRDDPKARVASRHGARHIDTAVLRAVVYDNALPVPKALPLDAAQAGRQRLGGVEDG